MAENTRWRRALSSSLLIVAPAAPLHGQARAPSALSNGAEPAVVAGVYEKTADRESALEMLRARAATPAESKPATRGQGTSGTSAPASPASDALGGPGALIFGSTGPRGGKRDGLVDVMAKSAARSAGSALSRTLLRGVLGSLSGSRRR